MWDNNEILMEKIINSEMILIGIGSEFSNRLDKIEQTKLYHKISNDLEIEDIKGTNYFPYVIYDFLKKNKFDRILKGYHQLASKLIDKNFFIISTNMDDLIWKSNLDKERIVAPCGGYQYLQCSQGCCNKLEDSKEISDDFITQIINIDNCKNIIFPQCKNCGSDLVFNNTLNNKYVEDGYLSQWEKYTTWLQGTLNKSICIIELGVDMTYPSVIRWPFEKINFYNQKSSFFRVNERLYQLSEELKEKGASIQENALDFIVNKFV
ncbi:MAG TPA: hypothetical protein VJZ04_03205 [Lachnospiraceae bacterium]|nr:hypothetical protein [Lachnospiraceae bacterium]